MRFGADAYTEDAASAAEQAKKYADSGFCAKAAAGEFDLTEEELKAFEEKERQKKQKQHQKRKLRL